MPLKPCLEPGCGSYSAYRGRCSLHAKQNDKSMRRAGRATYDTKAWHLLRRSVLFEESLCRVCGQIATDVDHINGDPSDNRRINLQPLCHRDHSIKTRREQMEGMGRVA